MWETAWGYFLVYLIHYTHVQYMYMHALRHTYMYVVYYTQWSRNRGGQGASGPPNFRARGA